METEEIKKLVDDGRARGGFIIIPEPLTPELEKKLRDEFARQQNEMKMMIPDEPQKVTTEQMSNIDLTAKSGDWRWAGAQLYAGRKVGGQFWMDRTLYVELRDDGYIYYGGRDETFDDLGPTQPHWELWEPAPPPPEHKPPGTAADLIRHELETYGLPAILDWAETNHPGLMEMLRRSEQEPAPAPAPKPVRWKLKRLDGALRTTGVGACGIPIDALVSRDWHGHRLLNFICIPPEGEDVEVLALAFGAGLPRTKAHLESEGTER